MNLKKQKCLKIRSYNPCRIVTELSDGLLTSKYEKKFLGDFNLSMEKEKKVDEFRNSRVLTTLNNKPNINKPKEKVNK